jgi:hypothetical protein
LLLNPKKGKPNGLIQDKSGRIFHEGSVRLALSKGLNRVGVSVPSPENGNRSSFRNVAFSSYLELQTVDKIQKTSGIHRYENLLDPSVNKTFQEQTFPFGSTNREQASVIEAVV